MADKKISQLTAASTPLTGSEVLPIVQSSATVKVAVSDLTAGRSISASGATITNGGAIRVYRPGGAIYTDQYMAAGGSGGYIFNNANNDGFKWQFAGTDQFAIDTSGNWVPKVAAKGINFTANTGAAGMTSQLLNWYEEGTWTPNQGAGLTLVGAFSSAGTYTRIGRQVFIRGSVSGATSVAVASAGAITTNLPYSAAADATGTAIDAANTASSILRVSSATLTAATAIAATTTITFSAVYSV